MHYAGKGAAESSSELPAIGSCLSNGDAIILLEIIHKSLTCDSEEEFPGLFPKIQELFPFDFAGTLAGRHNADNELFIDHGINVSFPDEWVREYSAKNYFYLDHITKETFRTCQARHWAYLTQSYEVNVPKEIKTLNLDLGMKECYTHGANAIKPGQKGSIFCFSGPSIKSDPRTIVIMEYIIPHLHLALARICDKVQTEKKQVSLTTRELEVLNWLKKGKSSWDMSVILKISERTVNYHVYNILRKLEVVNRPQALAVAAGMGLIEMS
jgi:DNA-binding CsgD family transcriptional regulator